MSLSRTQEIEEIMVQCDRNHDNKISFKEFYSG
jgi:Ca2+-binding EF-hand superfamily protein